MLSNSYLSKPLFRGILGLAASFAITATAHAANMVVNPSFESPSTAPGVEYPGAGDGWTAFDAVFTINNAVEPQIVDGEQALKMFAFGGAFQDFDVNEGDIVTGTAEVLNSTADQMANGQVAAVNLEWFDAGGNSIAISFGSSIDASSDTDVWQTIGVVDAIAPVGSETVRLTLITGDFNPDVEGFGGAPRFDSAFLEITPAVVPIPAAVWLFGSGLIGLVGLARRRKS
jgi:hypothetical protein